MRSSNIKQCTKMSWHLKNPNLCLGQGACHQIGKSKQSSICYQRWNINNTPRRGIVSATKGWTSWHMTQSICRKNGQFGMGAKYTWIQIAVNLGPTSIGLQLLSRKPSARRWNLEIRWIILCWLSEVTLIRRTFASLIFSTHCCNLKFSFHKFLQK